LDLYGEDTVTIYPCSYDKIKG